MAEPILRVEGICKAFPGVRALDAVNFDLYQGEVHAVIGENGAGKSTLIKLISGVYQRDSGSFFLKGKRVEIGSIKNAQELGIATTYQELNLAPNLTVAQNIFLGREPKRRAARLLVDRETARIRTSELLASLCLDIPPNKKVKELSVSEKQMVGIAKALSMKSSILILDEPTAALAEKETNALFKIIVALKEQGLGIIYISHRLEEISQIADRVTVLRDGQNIGTLEAKKADTETLIKMMVGRALKDQFPRRFTERGDVILELRDISRTGILDNINMQICRGEIVGLAGLVGAGRTEIARVLFGIDHFDSGEIRMEGKRVSISSPSKAIKFGIALLPEDRKELGLFQRLSVKENIVISAMKELFRKGIISRKKVSELASRFVEKLQIRTPSLSTFIESLSGGNQQKIVIAKWFVTKARLFIFDEPTRGIDVGAKREIHKLMDSLVHDGIPVLMISSELPEIIGMSDRIYVMHKGRIVSEYSKAEATQELILKSAMGKKW